MEASQQEPQESPVQDSQQEPQQDSGLQTPQPDQPVPTEAERQAAEQTVPEPGPQATVGPSGQVAEGTVSAPQYPTNEEQQAQADQREQDLETARREHNERTGGGEIREGELQAQREEHNARSGGGQPAPESAPEADQA